MLAYTIRRLLLAVLTIVGVSAVVFFVVRLAPGDVVSVRLGESGQLSTAQIEEARKDLGLDDPSYVQYFRWAGDVARGDFGNSLWTGRSVGSQISEPLVDHCADCRRSDHHLAPGRYPDRRIFGAAPEFTI